MLWVIEIGTSMDELSVPSPAVQRDTGPKHKPSPSAVSIRRSSLEIRPEGTRVIACGVRHTAVTDLQLMNGNQVAPGPFPAETSEGIRWCPDRAADHLTIPPEPS